MNSPALPCAEISGFPRSNMGNVLFAELRGLMVTLPSSPGLASIVTIRTEVRPVVPPLTKSALSRSFPPGDV